MCIFRGGNGGLGLAGGELDASIPSPSCARYSSREAIDLRAAEAGDSCDESLGLGTGCSDPSVRGGSGGA